MGTNAKQKVAAGSDHLLGDRVAWASAIMGQAESVLELIGDSEDDPKASACFGAATIIRAAVEVLGDVEVALREKRL